MLKIVLMTENDPFFSAVCEKCYRESWIVNIWAINISPAYDMIYIILPISIKKSFFIIKERLDIGKWYFFFY